MPSTSVEPSSLKNAFTAVCGFCRNYNQHKGALSLKSPEVHEVIGSLNIIRNWAVANFGRFRDESLQVDISRGIGGFPRVPWVCILPPGQKVGRGIYVAICFGREGAGAIVGFGQSVTHPQGLPTVIRSKTKPISINVDGVCKIAKFNNAFVNPNEFRPEDFDETAFRQHINDSLKLCFERLKSNSAPAIPSKKGDQMDINKMLPSLDGSMRNAGLYFRPTLLKSFVASLKTKPFLILTGLSGSGKTKLALAFARWIAKEHSQYELVAVGADWTSNENLLGYPDALKARSYRKPDNGALELILRAQANPEAPFFLILDEMNLSHVERYFADFLSAMETGVCISLHDGDENEMWDGVAGKLRIPNNLFVIGTVNVDETTYMFSPKVLDRANVLEFRVSKEEMNGFLDNPAKPELDQIAGQGSKFARVFAAAATDRAMVLRDKTHADVSKVLMEFFPSLKEVGAEFGYRTAHEICRFIHFHKELSGSEWEYYEAMDAAIMQKLLPKLHGSKKKLGPVLDKLAELCEGRFKDASEKIARMQKRLNEHGFASFAEA